MKPYYKDEWTTIYLGDCREILPELDPAEINCCITDPDYNAKAIGVFGKTYDTAIMHISEEEYNQFCSEWFSKVREITPNIAFTPGIRNIWKYPAAKWMIAWHRPGSKCFNDTGGFNIWEPILIYGKMGPFSEDHITRVADNFANGPEKEHPCPKTRVVWEWLVNKASKPGMTILDPFLGSGTTAVCAKKLGRRSIGIEISEKYCQIAVERLRQSVMNLVEIK